MSKPIVIGKCIYCQSTDEPLTREHIVPFGLNGQWVLQKATCDTCKDITSKFELSVLKNALKGPRASLEYQSRRKPPKTLPANVNRDTENRAVEIPTEKYPSLLLMPIMPLPAYIDGRKYDHGVQITKWNWHQVGKGSVDETREDLDAEDLTIEIRYEPVAYALLLAKIAYGLMVMDFGIDNIDDAYVLPSILGEKDNVGRWVGCSNEIATLPTNQYHSFHLRLSLETNEVHCFVRLFQKFNTPEYFIVPGKVTGFGAIKWYEKMSKQYKKS